MDTSSAAVNRPKEKRREEKNKKSRRIKHPDGVGGGKHDNDRSTGNPSSGAWVDNGKLASASHALGETGLWDKSKPGHGFLALHSI